VTSPRFELSLDREACWRHNHIAHLGASQPPAALFDLVGRLSVNLKAAGIAFDARPFAPHVTLVRKADCARHLARGKDGNEAGNEVGNEAGNENPASGPIRWSARDFVLVRSSLRAEGARYEQLGRWPLL
jgi:2'-5' RNA ligase